MYAQNQLVLVSVLSCAVEITIVLGNSNAALTVVVGFVCHQVYHKHGVLYSVFTRIKQFFLKRFLNDPVILF